MNADGFEGFHMEFVAAGDTPLGIAVPTECRGVVGVDVFPEATVVSVIPDSPKWLL